MKLLEIFSPWRQPEDSIAESPIDAEPRRAVVALGGGGARGIAHLGAMQAIGESGVQIERIVGVSMGSLVGAMCALEPDILRVQSQALQLLHSPIFQLKQQELCGATPPTGDEHSGSTFSWYTRLTKVLSAHRRLARAATGPSLISDESLRDAIESLIPDVDIADVPCPLSIVAVDLFSGQRVVLEKGPLRLAVQASSAIPGIFPPVRWDHMMLCDIGVIESLPTLLARSYASDLTIGVDVSQDPTCIDRCDTALDVMIRLDDICERMMRRHVIEAADLVIRPQVGDVAWFDFSHPEDLIKRGRAAAHQALAMFANRHVA
ncbi:patatin-like phospholipase family protein [Neorhodopirellula lusitana]|uniref:patatin-like phospholipase family protein n=1 Tax=Neorhodopirellula lusitana TaxID=445327 RepID=UPI0038511F05